MRTAKRATSRLLRRAGYEVRRIDARPNAPFVECARRLAERHDGQTQRDVVGFTEKYRAPVFGCVRVWDLLERLAQCIDPGDPALGCVSQLTHLWQVVDGMHRDGVSDPDLLLSGLVHDIGKVLLLTAEDPAHIGGMNRPIGVFEKGIGFDNCIFQWNHDEFGYSRLKDYVPDHVAWLVRYHSVRFDECQDLMDERDQRYFNQYYSVLSKYDNSTKSMYELPQAPIDDYRSLVEEAFPRPILF